MMLFRSGLTGLFSIAIAANLLHVYGGVYGFALLNGDWSASRGFGNTYRRGSLRQKRTLKAINKDSHKKAPVNQGVETSTSRLSMPTENTQRTNVQKQKHVLVTGANRGIGYAICRRLLEENSDVIVWLGSRNLSKGKVAGEYLIRSLIRRVNATDWAAVSQQKERLFVVQIDVTSNRSIRNAVRRIQKQTDSLYGVVNNAGIKLPNNYKKSIEVNYFGPRRVNDAFRPMIQTPGGRIVNLASEFSGPNFVNNCQDRNLKQKLAEPWTIRGGVKELDLLARDPKHCIENGGDAYGFSKAMVCAYTYLLAQEQQFPNDLIVNSVSPGFIDTEMTKGQGATDQPSTGAIAPTWLLMSKDLETIPSGRFYGGDCKRSPLHYYRYPGSPPYEGLDGPQVLE